MRIKRLDGLRAVAILMLILSAYSFIDLGWTGIELFLVLTGFLMTRILRDSRTNESYWSRFYLKRAVRVLPLMFLVLLANKLVTHRLSFIGVAGYALLLGDVVNMTHYAAGSVSELGSIAIGAHFLLLWSVAVRFLSRRTLLIIAVALLLIEPTLRHFYTPYSPDFGPIFGLTIFRLDSLVAGSLLALLAEDENASRYLARWSGWAALALATIFLAVSHLLSPWFVRMTNTVLYNTTAYSMLAAIYFFVVAWVLFLKEGGLAERLLSSSPMIFIAKISYGLDLFNPFIRAILKKLLHQPFGEAGEPGSRKIFPIAIVLSVSLCTLLYRYVEVPILAWGKRKARQLEVEDGDPVRTEQDAIAVIG